MLPTSIICFMLLSCQLSFSSERQPQNPLEKGNETDGEDRTEASPEVSTETPTDDIMFDALNETDSLQNETTLNNGTADEETDEYEDTTTASDLAPTSTEPPGIDHESDFAVQDFCLCDLKIGACDVNCCCDEDCDGDDRKVFSHCQERPQPVLDSKYCFQEHLIFSNHTEYSVDYMHDGAFCIITDNLPQRTTYTPVKGATNIEEYGALEKKRRRYSWPSISKTESVEFDQYRDGSPVWGMNENRVPFPLGIPVSVVGSECEAVTSVLYLRDAESSCNRPLQDVALDCESNARLNALHYVSFSIIADPNNLHQNATTKPEHPKKEGGTDVSTNSSTAEEIPQHSNRTTEENEGSEDNDAENTTKQTTENRESDRQQRRLISASEFGGEFVDLRDSYQLLSLRTYLCRFENDDEICMERNPKDIPLPLYSNGMCRNVLSSINYIFTHNGSEGLYDVHAKIFLANISNVVTHASQVFLVKYSWASTNEEVIFERSGRPGYIRGKPLLVGSIIENRTEDDILKEAIYLPKNPKRWLTILSPGQTGNCEAFSQVDFGVDMRTGCLFKALQEDFNGDCAIVQERILKHLLRSPSLNDERLRIASYGDSSVNNPADWVPILIPEEPRCSTSSKLFGIRSGLSLVTSVHIEVAFSLQGSLANPQHKVVGVSLRYGEPREIRPSCSGVVCRPDSKDTTRNIELVSSVSFVDVTQPPLPAYSRPPALDVKLPYDFFYPFLPSSSSRPDIECLSLLCIISVLIVVI